MLGKHQHRKYPTNCGPGQAPAQDADSKRYNRAKLFPKRSLGGTHTLTTSLRCDFTPNGKRSAVQAGTCTKYAYITTFPHYLMDYQTITNIMGPCYLLNNIVIVNNYSQVICADQT